MILLILFLVPFLGKTASIILTTLIVVVAFIVWTIRKKQRYWERHGIKYIKPRFLLGSSEIFRTKSSPEQFQEFYRAFPEERYHGVYKFTIPHLIVKDPDLIKQITVKDFDHFVNHRQFGDPEVDRLFSRNLIASRDEKWRNMRATLSPSFTGSKMKMMFVLMEECALQFVRYFQSQNQDVLEVDVKDAVSRYTNDVIATTAFGLKCDSLKHKTNRFYLMGKDVKDISGLRLFKFIFCGISPFLFKLLRLQLVPGYLARYFSDTIETTLRTRREKNIVRPDMIQLLLEAQKENRHQEITTEDIVAQAFFFFLAGFETVSTHISFMLHELALHPHIQTRLREEINSVEGEITYDSLLGLKYLNMVVSESLRKWPAIVFTDRQVSSDYVIEPVNPGEKPLRLEKGLICWLPIFGLHRDPRYYPKPEAFDPERFSDDNKHKINPSTYFPFGLGPRSCIGARFGLLESKLLVFYLLKNFELVPISTTKNPIVLDKKQFNLVAEGGMWLGFKKLTVYSVFYYS